MEQHVTDTYPPISSRYVVTIALGFLALALVLALPWMHWIQGRDLQYALLGPQPLYALLLGAVTGALFTPIAWYVFHRLPTLQRNLRQLETTLPLRQMGLFDIVLVALSAGVGEEILFRGAIQHALGLWGTSFLFGLMHPLSLAYVLYATVAGLLLGWLAIATQSLLAPIVCHTIIDALLLWAARRESQQRILSSKW